jgi:type II secretory ATPase GspE/PulE/Tfp pilus assembly ATPase PilB-like protein
MEMGVEDYLINASVIGLIAQRIVRKNCPFCSVADNPSEDLLKEYNVRGIADKYSHLLDGEIRFMRGKGCPKCAGTGYMGRMAIFELFDYTEELKEVFLKKMSIDALSAVLRENSSFRSLREDGMLKVAKGLTTIEEVLRVC